MSKSICNIQTWIHLQTVYKLKGNRNMFSLEKNMTPQNSIKQLHKKQDILAKSQFLYDMYLLKSYQRYK